MFLSILLGQQLILNESLLLVLHDIDDDSPHFLHHEYIQITIELVLGSSRYASNGSRFTKLVSTYLDDTLLDPLLQNLVLPRHVEVIQEVLLSLLQVRLLMSLKHVVHLGILELVQLLREHV